MKTMTMTDEFTGDTLHYAQKLERDYYIFNDSTFTTHVIVKKVADTISHVVALKTEKLSKAVDYFNTYIK